MPNNQEIINQAKILIKQGEANYASGSKKGRRGYTNSAHYLKYHQAHRLLLKHGYEETENPLIQQAYTQLIPDNKIFIKEKAEWLDKLSSSQPFIRLKTIRYIVNTALYVGNPRYEAWLAHPVTVSLLIDTLQKETDPKVAVNITITLGAIYTHYFKDKRIFPELLKVLDNNNTDLQVAAINWTAFFDEDEKWDKVIHLLKTKKYQKTLVAVCNHIKSAKQIPTQVKLQFLSLLINCRKRKINKNNRFYLLYAIISLIDNNTIDHFQALTNIRKDEELSEALNKYIEMNENPEEHHTSETNLSFVKNRLLSH